MNYILVNESGQAVPLLFHTGYIRDDNGERQACTVHNISREPRPGHALGRSRRGALEVRVGTTPYYGWDPADLGLRIITEAEYMESQT